MKIPSLLLVLYVASPIESLHQHRIPSLSSASSILASSNRSAFVRKELASFPRSKNVLLLRGGATSINSIDVDDSDEDYSEDETSDEDEDDSESEEEIKDAVDDNNDDEQDEDESSASALNTPVKLSCSTSLYKKTNPLIDQSIEITASPSRTVSSLKQTISKQLKSKPPVECVVLKLDGMILNDGDATVSQLVEDHEDDEDDDEDEDDGDDDMPKLKIHIDIIPPVDPKFGTEFRQRLESMTNEEILDSYVSNMASMHQNSLDMFTLQNDVDQHEDAFDEEDDEENEEISVQSASNELASLSIQKYAMVLKEQIKASLSEKELVLLSNSHPTSEDGEGSINNTGGLADGDILLKESIKRRRKRRGGATMNVKRALQKNLNINWADTIRNFLLFLFFGYFGGKNATSRTIMLLGAPACFIIQARPVKIAMKQLFYAIGEPHGLFLSLLPAPQQAIMSCDYDESMKGLYGDKVGLFNELVSNDDDNVNDDYDDEGTDVDVDMLGESEYDDEYDDDY